MESSMDALFLRSKSLNIRTLIGITWQKIYLDEENLKKFKKGKKEN